jgi:hypothetical protein
MATPLQTRNVQMCATVQALTGLQAGSEGVLQVTDDLQLLHVAGDNETLPAHDLSQNRQVLTPSAGWLRIIAPLCSRCHAIKGHPTERPKNIWQSRLARRPRDQRYPGSNDYLSLILHSRSCHSYQIWMFSTPANGRPHALRP